jgi:exopolysaccharide production protein ExoY
MKSSVLPALKKEIPQKHSPFKIRHHPLKRVFDFCFSLLSLILLSPLLIAIAIAIRCISRGNIIYAQPRLGRGGKIFICYKFRTMHLDAEEKLDSILSSNPRYKREWRHKQKLKNDPRIIPLGKWLRQTSLDELPQFWNVLKGDLSVVGPSPYMIFQKQDLGYFADKILSVRPGITGLWQTSGRSRTTFQKRIALDLEYIDKSSFPYDLFLILKTIPLLLFSRNAY